MRSCWLVFAVAASLLAACTSATSETAVVEEIGLVFAPGQQSDWFEEELAAHRAAGDRAAICMREQGYEYIPWSSLELVTTSLTGKPPAGTVEYATDHGYGILHNLPAAIRSHPSAKQDPNAVFVDGLTREQWFAYQQTLHGINGGDGIKRDGVDEELYRAGGCLGRELRAVTDYDEANLRGTLLPAWWDLEERANADQRMLDYDRTWSTCMAESGYQYASSAQAQASFTALHEEIWLGASFPTDGYLREDLQALSAAERTDLYRGEVAFDEQAWSDALALEIEIAVADLRCQSDQPRYDVYIEVLRDIEDRFVEENRTVIDQLLESADA